MSKSKLLYPLLLAGVLSFSLLGCSDDDVDDAVEGTKNVAEDPNLLGTFSGECAGAGFINASMKMAYRFEGNSFTQTQSFYSDDNCASDKKIGELKYEGEFDIDSDSKTVSNGGAVDIHLEKAGVTVNEQSLADLFNGIKFCGKDDYAPGDQVTLGEAETDAVTCPVDKVPSTRYGAYTVDGDTLYLNQDGLRGMATKESDRPDQVLKSEGYKN